MNCLLRFEIKERSLTAMACNLELVPDEDLLEFSSIPPVVPNEQGDYPIPVPGQTKYY